MSEYEFWKGLSERADAEMARLESRGLTDLGPLPEDAAQRAGEEQRFRSEPEKAEARPVRLDKNQIVWVRPHGAFVGDRGYRRIEVSDEPPSPDVAIVAALTALAAVPVDPPEGVRKILPSAGQREQKGPHPEDLFGGRLGDEGEDLLDIILLEPLFRGFEKTALGQTPEVRRHLDYVQDLLRHFRPGFGELPREEQIALIEHTCRHVNGFLEALRKLVEFAEHGTASGDISPAVKQAARDVEVAELHDVTGKSYVKIARIIGEPPPEKHASNNDHPKVRKMGNRGRMILEEAFGKEGWNEKIAAMKEEAARWSSLSKGDRWLETVSVLVARIEFVGMPLEEARGYVERILDRKARAQGVTREEAARRWAERYTHGAQGRHD